MSIFGPKVVATLSEEEVDQFKKLQYKTSSIKTIQDNLVDSLAELYEMKFQLWEDVKEKYNLIGLDLSLNVETRELTKQ